MHRWSDVIKFVFIYGSRVVGPSHGPMHYNQMIKVCGCQMLIDSGIIYHYRLASVNCVIPLLHTGQSYAWDDIDAGC